MRKLLYIFIICLCLPQFTFSQVTEEEENTDPAAFVFLQEVTISNVPDSFDADFFISRVTQDTTFFLAFHHLRTSPYSFQITSKQKDAEQTVEGSWDANGTRSDNGVLSKGKIVEETFSGKVKRKRKRKLSLETLRLLEGLFTDTYSCKYAYTQLAPDIGITDLGDVEVQKALMKQLIFFPGTELPVPFFGDKCALFTQEMIPLYTYEIYQSTLHKGEFVFEITQKEGVKTNETVFKKMITRFRESDLFVTHREYHMKYNALLFDFDIEMVVDIDVSADNPFPKTVDYSGNWKIPFAKRERVDFVVTHKLERH